jgi:hypothetical protein
MSGKEFQSRAFARFVDDANVSRQAIVISGANEIMGSGAPEHHPFFQHLMGYDLPVFVTTTDPVKFEQPAPSTEDAMHNAGAAKQFLKSQFSSLVTNAVETAMGNVQQSLQQMGLPIGEGAANYQKSLPLFAHSIQFVPFVTPEAKNYAFERALGVSGDDQALMHSVPTMTIRDLIMAKHRGSKIIGFEPSAMKYAMLLNKNGTNVPASAFVEPKLAKV